MPFRQYFYIDSEHHLISNGIITSARDTFNAVEIDYVTNASYAFDNSRSGQPHPSAFFTTGSLKMKANDALREDTAAGSTPGKGTVRGRTWPTATP